MKNFYLLFYKLTKNQNTAIQILTWLLLPGTVIHEVSHMIIAELLGVRTGKFSFIPEIIEEGSVKAGSLTMQKTGPVRQTIIGLAPTILGIGLIGLIGHYLYSLPRWPPQSNGAGTFDVPNGLLGGVVIFTLLYFLFVLSNTMFSSPKDLEQILFPLVLIAIIGGAFWLGGLSAETLVKAELKITLSIKLFNALTEIFKPINWGLGITIIVNLILLGLTKFLNSVIIKAK